MGHIWLKTHKNEFLASKVQVGILPFPVRILNKRTNTIVPKEISQQRLIIDPHRSGIGIHQRRNYF